MRDSIMMYRSQCEAIRNLPPEQFKAVVCALWDYEMDGTVPEGDPVTMAMFLMAKPMIDKRNAHYESGKKGGRPQNETLFEEEENQTKPNDNQTEPNGNQIEPNKTVKDKGKRIKDKGERIKDKEDKIKDIGERLKKKELYSACDAIIDHLNKAAGTNYRSTSKETIKYISARLSEDFSVDDFFAVIDKKAAEWKGTDMEKFLRPQTLFSTKFESYLNQQITKKDRYSDVDAWARRGEVML